MSPPSHCHVLVTGASRGIGLALAAALLREGHAVLATCRRPEGASDLQALAASSGGRATVIALDVRSDASAAALATHLDGGPPLDILINNAGVFPEGCGSFTSCPPDAFLEAFDTNLAGVVRVTRACLPSLRRSPSPRIVNLSSLAGSVTTDLGRPFYAYGVSKAALNRLTVDLARELGPEGFCVVPISPGWVRTDMGGPSAEIPVETAAGDIAAMVGRLSPKENGRFLDRHGAILDDAW